MNILIVGSGGREHTFAWKIKQSPRCGELYVAPGNAGTAQIATNVAIDVEDFDSMAQLVTEKDISLIVVGPEVPLVAGIRDYFRRRKNFAHVMVIGPGAIGAKLEGSKDFAKGFMSKYQIPTAKFQTFDSLQLKEAIEYARTMPLPVVLKADGLAAGKGVVICETYKKAEETLKSMLESKLFGDASSKVVIEQFLKGVEVSVFVLSDGENYVILPEAKDYKRIGDGDTGPNTGGMGAVSPVNFVNARFMDKVEKKIIQPTMEGLKKEKINYVGFIFIGLMNVAGEPYVIEYNVRMGDPETQVVIPRVKNDLIDLFEATAKGQLDHFKLEIDATYATTVVCVAKGYPDTYEKGKEIKGLEDVKEALVFHAGTKQAEDGEVLTNGGRVLAFTGIGNSVPDSLRKSYDAIKKVCWDGITYRKDIGMDIISMQ